MDNDGWCCGLSDTMRRAENCSSVMIRRMGPIGSAAEQ